MKRDWKSVVALSGGIGGARLLDGLAGALPPGALTAIVNTGDDFEHWGLHISPDLDTVMYTLAGLADQERGWGLEGETFRALAMMERYRGETWFQLGDGDLATHVLRTQALRAGESLSVVTARLCDALNLPNRILPMADAPRPTMIDTRRRGTLSFQDWLVGFGGAPEVIRVWSEGPTEPAPGVLEAIADADVVILPPSNPYVSIDPILALDGVADAVRERPVVAVSPIVAGEAIKGPLAGMIQSLGGRDASAQAVADHYGDLVDGMVLEIGDEVALPSHHTETVMGDRNDRIRLAEEVLAFCEEFAA